MDGGRFSCCCSFPSLCGRDSSRRPARHLCLRPAHRRLRAHKEALNEGTHQARLCSPPAPVRAARPASPRARTGGTQRGAPQRPPHPTPAGRLNSRIRPRRVRRLRAPLLRPSPSLRGLGGGPPLSRLGPPQGPATPSASLPSRLSRLTAPLPRSAPSQRALASATTSLTRFSFPRSPLPCGPSRPRRTYCSLHALPRRPREHLRPGLGFPARFAPSPAPSPAPGPAPPGRLHVCAARRPGGRGARGTRVGAQLPGAGGPRRWTWPRPPWPVSVARESGIAG